MDLADDFFSALRRMKARGSGPEMAPNPTMQVSKPDESPLPAEVKLTVGSKGIALIKRFEGCARKRDDGQVHAYPDPGTGGAPWTIGWGATGPGILRGTVWSQAQCDARLENDLVRFAREVRAALAGAPTSPNQFDALVSFHYNTGAIARTTLTRLHKQGQFPEAAGQFSKWVYAGGHRLPGLVRRRAAEANLYSGGFPV